MANTPHHKKMFKKLSKLKKFTVKKVHVALICKNILWFLLGSILGLFFFISFLYIFYTKTHEGRVYDGVLINGIDFSGKTEQEAQSYFTDRNKRLQKVTFTLFYGHTVATVSAKEIDFGYDAKLMAHQSLTVGRSGDNTLSNMSLILQAYMHNINLPPSYHYSEESLDKKIGAINTMLNVQPIDPLFNFEDGKVVTFRDGKNGRTVDDPALKEALLLHMKRAIFMDGDKTIMIRVPVKIIHAADVQKKADSMGIKEEVAEGTSLFHHSSAERIYNLSLAANRLNGIIIKPNEIFSFDKAVGDISALNGYKQAYVIQNGKTVLGDGGGVCQVSTTLFRAALNAGLPITERHQHAYRVGYYEEDSGPGIDAAIYSPTVDLKFKNDTGHFLLIQTWLDTTAQRLTFALYGTKDDRQVRLTDPVVTNETPAPDPVYQDDPTLPKGQIKQIDFAAAGANVNFTRTVTKDGKQTIHDTFTSNYRPWKAVYLRGTKE